ncbi:hypothetical protein QJS66_21020 [Kocuria rhizophila]|nr:hypothetical protein QJS66_21020 [Kocuria rhizophila]
MEDLEDELPWQLTRAGARSVNRGRGDGSARRAWWSTGRSLEGAAPWMCSGAVSRGARRPDLRVRWAGPSPEEAAVALVSAPPIAGRAAAGWAHARSAS